MKKDIFLGSVLLAMAVMLLVELRKTKNPAIMADQVSAATFPNLLVWVLALLAVLLIGSSFIKLKKEQLPEVRSKSPALSWSNLKHTYQVPALMFALLCCYIFLTPVVGFYSMTFLFFTSTGILLGGPAKKNLMVVIPGALVSIAGVYYIFQVYMRVIMPAGFFF